MQREQLYISKPQARKRFDQLCEEKNKEMPMMTVTRQIEIDGKSITQTYQRRKKAVSDGAQNTGKALIQSFAWQFSRLVKDMSPDYLNSTGTPSLKTNNVRMAKFRGNLSDRTIRNHIRELKSIGLIVDYKYHGSKANFELWLSPEVLFGTPEMPEIFKVEQPDPFEKSRTETPVFEPANDTNFPHRQLVSIENLKVTKNTTTKTVDKNAKLWQPEYGNKPSTAQDLPLSQHSGDSMETKKGGGGRLVTVDNTTKQWISDLDRWKTPGEPQDYRRLPRQCQHYVAHFWKYAKKELWPGKVFLPQEEFAAMNSITASIYHQVFRIGPSDADMNKYHKLQLKALDKAAAYYRKTPDRFPGDPFAKFKQGSGYFDQENNRGFKVAQRWAQKDAAAQHERYGEKVLDTAIRHLKNHHSGKVPKRLQHLSFIELYRHYETKLKSSFSVELVNDFYKQALTLPAFKR